MTLGIWKLPMRERLCSPSALKLPPRYNNKFRHCNFNLPGGDSEDSAEELSLGEILHITEQPLELRRHGV
jgi:hypothetical protein